MSAPDTDRYYDGGDERHLPGYLPESEKCSQCGVSDGDIRFRRKRWCGRCLKDYAASLIFEADDLQAQAEDLRVAAGKALEAAK